MSHHFKAKGGTVFNFNSDLSGDARLLDGERYEAHVPCADLFAFVDYYRREYRDDESEKVDEQLTDEERAMIAEYPWPRTPQAAAHEKLLRIHDRLQARVEELERKPSGIDRDEVQRRAWDHD